MENIKYEDLKNMNNDDQVVMSRRIITSRIGSYFFNLEQDEAIYDILKMAMQGLMNHDEPVSILGAIMNVGDVKRAFKESDFIADDDIYLIKKTEQKTE